MQRFLGIIVGIILLGLGIFIYIRNDTLIKNCTEETTAIVVDMKQDISSDDDGVSYMYYPIIEYTVNDETYRQTMSSGSNTPAYNINEKITILYNPNKPTQFIVKGEKTSSIFSIIFMALGVLVTGCGIKMALDKK